MPATERSPYPDITFAGVYWNDAPRVHTLLNLARQWFANVVVGVQDSPDGTLYVAREYADVVVTDRHHGYAEPTIGRVLAKIKTPYTFLVSADEWPDDNLLESLPAAVGMMRQRRERGVWIRFHSSIEGIALESEQAYHLRLFASTVPWPATLHSRPQCDSSIWWDMGGIRHERSLDELISDYLRYYQIGRNDQSWTDHNLLMIKSACELVAEHRGWVYVKDRHWWPEVERIAFAKGAT